MPQRQPTSRCCTSAAHSRPAAENSAPATPLSLLFPRQHYHGGLQPTCRAQAQQPHRGSDSLGGSLKKKESEHVCNPYMLYATLYPHPYIYVCPPVASFLAAATWFCRRLSSMASTAASTFSFWGTCDPSSSTRASHTRRTCAAAARGSALGCAGGGGSQVRVRAPRGGAGARQPQHSMPGSIWFSSMKMPVWHDPSLPATHSLCTATSNANQSPLHFPKPQTCHQPGKAPAAS